MIYFTSDTHFGHDNIIRLANRPFSSVEEMNETLIARWNMVVKPGDQVYHLGDFALKISAAAALKILDRLNGAIHFIAGNHDDVAYSLRHEFESYRAYHELKVGEQKIVLFHYPIRSWNGIFKGSWQLYGHVHGLLPGFGKSMDVGGDVHNFNPLSFDEVEEMMDGVPLATEESGFPNYVPLEKRFK